MNEEIVHCHSELKPYETFPSLMIEFLYKLGAV